MSTFAILIGFCLMLFLPVVIAVARVRDHEEDLDQEDPYADRMIETHVVSRFGARVVFEEVAPAPMLPLYDDFETLETGDVSDPLALARGPRVSSTRLERAEMDAMAAQAVASRAHAEALAALARAALARAEEADVKAMMLEQEAALARNEVRRAA